MKAIKNTQRIVEEIVYKLKDKNRNIISDEFEESLEYLKKYIDLHIHRYKTGTECWTWNVPPKWQVKDGYIKTSKSVLVSFKECPLHVMSYSVPVHKKIKGEELLKHIYVHKKIPHAIPYEFSFYEPKWGFCLTHEQRNNIEKDEIYEVIIDSEFINDYLSVGEYTIKGKSDEHIFFLCHIDHPYQINDGLIGCAVNTALATLMENKDLYYNYTFLFVPESIGSIAFLSHNEHLIPKIRYSIFVEMVGLDNPLILQKSYKGSELINSYALCAMAELQGISKSYPYLTVVGNDEKIFNAPGVSIPSISITRVNQEEKLKKKKDVPLGGKNEPALPYPEYHSHLDNIDIVDFHRVNETIEVLYNLCQIIEKDFKPVREFKGPVFLSKYDLWVDWRKNLRMSDSVTWLMYCLEGDMTAFQIAERLKLDFNEVVELLERFHDSGLIKRERIPIGFDR
ncbi:MAG: DUF4910 domain-containing protein [Candidatus Brocadiaceae bacterium]|nr:DUF4910 domain-containing protein [Candidatus Brocadiaceae bacterium]